jgi:putative ABC transport system ATP-binding protein
MGVRSAVQPLETTDESAAGPIVTARNLYRFFRTDDEETLALQGISLEVRAGELVAVTGPSGSGKSTLLACLAGIDDPSGGTVWIAGKRISHVPEAVRAPLRARHIGLLFQSGNLFPHLSVAENVRLSRSLMPGRGRADEHDLLESADIRHRATSYPHQLSGGELARAGLAVALANHPEVLLADEPTGELDGESERRLLELLRRQAGSGGAVVVASHSPAVRRIADRMLRLEDGRDVS